MHSLSPNFEKSIIKSSKYKRVIGIDEVGRGCWAGPTAIGAYIYTTDQEELNYANDSKLLSVAKREDIFKKLNPENYGIVLGSLKSINEIGIGKTIEKLIYKTILRYRDGQTLFLIDGQHSKNFGVDTLKLIKGDNTYYSIAIASIAAKVYRDNLMVSLGEKFPHYQFNKHKGYATKLHRDLIEKHGICSLHRTSFKPIKNILQDKIA